MKIALTFDDGPHPELTPRILDILDKYNVKATFFTIGENVEMYPDIVYDIVSRGHEVGNHTYTHPHITQEKPFQLKDEIIRCENAIYESCDQIPKLFRPPEGVADGTILSMVEEMGYRVILWDIDTRDWAHTSPDKIFSNVCENVKCGDIILMHDYIYRNSPTPEALDIILPELISRGYQFVCISELLGSG